MNRHLKQGCLRIALLLLWSIFAFIIGYRFRLWVAYQSTWEVVHFWEEDIILSPSMGQWAAQTQSCTAVALFVEGLMRDPFLGYFRSSVHPIWAYDAFLLRVLEKMGRPWVLEPWAVECLIQLLQLYLRLAYSPEVQKDEARIERLQTRMHVGWILLCLSKGRTYGEYEEGVVQSGLDKRIQQLAEEYQEVLTRHQRYGILKWVICGCGYVHCP